MAALLCIRNKTECISHVFLQIFMEYIYKALFFSPSLRPGGPTQSSAENRNFVSEAPIRAASTSSGAISESRVHVSCLSTGQVSRAKCLERDPIVSHNVKS